MSKTQTSKAPRYNRVVLETSGLRCTTWVTDSELAVWMALGYKESEWFAPDQYDEAYHHLVSIVDRYHFR